LEDLIYKI